MIKLQCVTFTCPKPQTGFPMKKKLSIVILALLFSCGIQLYSQAFVRAGVVSFDPRLTKFNAEPAIHQIPNYYLGGGMEASILKYFILELGANYYKINVDLMDPNSENINGSIIGFPVLFKVKPVKYFNAGVGLIPSVFLDQSVLEKIYYKEFDLSTTAKIEIRPIRSISIEACYSIGFRPGSIEWRDINGSIEKTLESNHHFYNLGLKYLF